ncbi:MAG: hypothetical protein CMJ54_00855 [Planctomycetaceae bacterium]|nr:hypothetical protein [Planctomycetaceae bacterium]
MRTAGPATVSYVETRGLPRRETDDATSRSDRVRGANGNVDDTCGAAGSGFELGSFTAPEGRVRRLVHSGPS